MHDSKVAVELLSDVNITGSNTLGDKAYGTAAIRDYITKQNAQHTIPPKENNPNHGIVTFGCIKSVIFLIKSRLFVWLLPVMISSLYLFWLLSMLLLYVFC